MQAADAAEQIGKALQIAGFFQLPAVHHRRKAHHLGAGFAMPRDQGGEPLDHVLVKRGSARRRRRCPSCGTAHRRGDPADRPVAVRSPTMRFGRLHSCSGFHLFVENVSRSIAQGGGYAAHQACGCDVGKDPVVVDHDRRRKHVAKMPANAEIAVVAISGQAACAHRAHDGCDRKFGCFHLEQVDLTTGSRARTSARSSCSWAGISIHGRCDHGAQLRQRHPGRGKVRGSGRHLAAGPASGLADEQLRAIDRAAAIPAQTEDQQRWATGVIVCA